MSEPRRFQITFRPPVGAESADTAYRTTYELALDFTAHVHAIVELAETERIHLRDTLDRKATGLAMALSRAANLPAASDRRTACGAALPAANDCATMLDIIGARATVPSDILTPARAVIRALITRLEGLAN